MGTDDRVRNLSDFRKESAEQLSKLIDDLNVHNREHSSGALMGKTLGKMLGAAADGEEPDLQKAQVDTTIEAAQGARTGLAELHTKHRTILNRFGLKLVHQTGDGLQYGLPSGPISMKIQNIHTFLRYAQSLPSASDSQQYAEPFNTLLNSVEEQISSMDFEHLSPDDKSVLENIDSIFDAFRRISPNLNLVRLGHFADFQRTNRLAQYLLVERAGLWKEPEKGFGPADWVRDITAQGLDERWSSVIKVFREQDMLGSSGVSKELHDHLVTCIKRALEQLSTLTYLSEVKEKFTEILEKYEKELES